MDGDKLETKYIVITFDSFEDKAFMCDQWKKDQYQIYFRADEIFKDLK